MRGTLENPEIFDPVFKAGMRYQTQKIAITATYTISSSFSSPPIIALDPASTTRQVNLPPILGATMPMEGRWQRIVNVSTGSGNLTVKNDAADGAATLASIGPGTFADFFVVNGAWVSDTLAALTLPPSTTTSPSITVPAGTLMTTVSAGALEFDGTAFYLSASAGARAQVDTEQFVIANADSSTYNNTGLDAATTPTPVFTTQMGAAANGAVALITGKTYLFEAQYFLTNTGTTSHAWQTLFAGTASIGSIEYYSSGQSTAGGTPGTGGLQGIVSVLTAVTATPASTSATEQAVINLQGVLVVTTGGTFIPQLQNTARPGASGTPGVVMKKGTFFRIWEMAPAAQVGNWT